MRDGGGEQRKRRRKMAVVSGGRGDERWLWQAKEKGRTGGRRGKMPWGKEAREREREREDGNR